MPRWCRRFVGMVPHGGAQSLCVLGYEIGGGWNASAMSLGLVALRSWRGVARK